MTCLSILSVALAAIITLTPLPINAWSLSKSSQASAFNGKSIALVTSRPRVQGSSSSSSKSSLVMYDNSRDPPNDKAGSNGKSNGPNAWTVLSNTEQWISTTLLNSNAASGGFGQNPYTRKEVSYVCEASGDSAMIVANLFRRLKEARQLGESHGKQEVSRSETAGSSYRPSTLRQTQVVVIPANDVLQHNFTIFNDLITAMNNARRSARDYVTEAHWERMDSAQDDEDDEEWAVSVTCAHLHPKFGEKTPREERESELQEMKQMDEEGEIDVHYQEFLKRRVMARQSPYPTVVIEVRATPPPDFQASSSSSSRKSDGPSEGVTAADIMKLEQLFGKSAHMNHPTSHTTKKQEEEAFYSAIGATDIQEFSAVSTLTMAQNYMARADPTIPRTAAFTESNTATVDEAYEFIFTNIAMMAETVHVHEQRQQRGQGEDDPPQDVRHYVVLPYFVTSAATSLEKFARQCQVILNTLPDLANRIDIETYHPEHVHETKRSPMPIVLLRWRK
ncbi:hypothetical protein ACA910_015086 [Epithemia clementina (nom. ined.)]